MAAPIEPVPPPSCEAEYALESPQTCPQCKKEVSTLQVVRLLRSKVNFTSTLPRRGRVLACPKCLTVMSGELGNLT